MKRIPAVLLAILVMPMAMPAVAQDPVATHIADDAAGDVKITLQGQATPPPADAFAAADLKALDVTEGLDEFIITVTVASLTPQAEAAFEGSTVYTVNFLQHDRSYRVRVSRIVAFTTTYSARLEGFDPGRGGYFSLLPLPLDVDPATGQMSMSVPRQAMTDANGAAPHPEIPISGFRAAAQGLALPRRNNKIGLSTEGLATVLDRMPDTGNATTELPVHFGVRQKGLARLSSEIPTRASNGEATTFVFQVQASNLGVAEETYTLTTTTIPASWTVKLPASQVTIPGNGSVSLPVLVTTPFTHTHGAFQNFEVHMKSVSDPGNEGAIQLGVRYMQPPQPAGHHNQLWFHSEPDTDDPVTAAAFSLFGGGASVWINAIDVDPIDKAVEVPAENAGTEANGTAARHAYQWDVPLSPGLEMGLDFDTAATGQIQVNVKSPIPALATVMSGRLVHYGKPPGVPGPGQPAHGIMTVLADIPATAAMDLQPGTPAVLQSTIVPTAAADFVAFEKGASLVLQLNLTMQRADAPFGPQAPVLVPGSTMTLPLYEYHDPVNDIFLSDVELVATTAQDRAANPGQSVLFNLTLENRAQTDGTFLLAIDGTNSQWARLLPAMPEVQVPAGGSYAFSIAVKVPSDVKVPTNPAAEKPAADLIVSATNQADLTQRALVRLYTTVDNGRHTDDAALIAKIENAQVPEDTPGFGSAAGLLALALVALALSRRR